MPEAVLAAGRRLLRERAAGLFAAGLLLAMATDLISVIARKSITIDKTVAIPSGYYYLTKGAFNLNSEHPPLPKMLAALPLLFLALEAPPPDAASSANSSQGTVVSAERFWQANRHATSRNALCRSGRELPERVDRARTPEAIIGSIYLYRVQ